MSKLKTIEYDTMYEDALFHIGNCYVACDGTYLMSCEYYMDDWGTLWELVKKQTPKKPIKESSSKGSVFYCPTCKNECSNKFNYCPNCGQVLKRIEKDYDKNK